MATLSLAPMVFKRHEGIGSTPIFHAKEKASQTYKQGALLVQDSGTGYFAECGADPTVVQGVALTPATGVTGADLMAVRPVEGAIFEISMDESGGQGLYPLAQTDFGKQYGVAKDSTSGYWYLDQDETSTKVLEIVGFVSAIGDITPRVEVKFTIAAKE